MKVFPEQGRIYTVFAFTVSFGVGAVGAVIVGSLAEYGSRKAKKMIYKDELWE